MSRHRPRLLNFPRVDSVPGNMADIVQIPIEAFKGIQHSNSIYKFRIYSQATHSAGIIRIGFNNALLSWPPPATMENAWGYTAV
jgi:hypothetical protein